MNPLEVSLHTWREQRLHFQKTAQTVVDELSKPIQLLSPPIYDQKIDELREYLACSYGQEQDPAFNYLYVHHIAFVKCKSNMQLAEELIGMFGGEAKFWQSKIYELASNEKYYGGFTMWEVNRVHEKYIGLSPERVQQLRRKHSLARQFLNCVSNILRLIDNSKATQESLLKLDDAYGKLKKMEHKYYSFLDELQSGEITLANKSKRNNKNTLLNFVKTKGEQVNTLQNYNFKINKRRHSEHKKLLKGREYQDFDRLMYEMRRDESERVYAERPFKDDTRERPDSSQDRPSGDQLSMNSINVIEPTEKTQPHQSPAENLLPIKEQLSPAKSNYSQRSNRSDRSEQVSVPISFEKPSVHALRQEMKKDLKSKKLATEPETHFTFLWNREFFYSFWGYPVKPNPDINLTEPFAEHHFVNYEIDSEDEYDEFNAQDVDRVSEESSVYSDSVGSFMVDDGEDSDCSRDDIARNGSLYQDRWQKRQEDLGDYDIVVIAQQEELPLKLKENPFSQDLVQQMDGKSKNEIYGIISSKGTNITKQSVEEFLKLNFKRIKTKERKIIYSFNGSRKAESLEVEGQVVPDEEQTGEEFVSRTLTYTQMKHPMQRRSQRLSAVSEQAVAKSSITPKQSK